MIYVQTFDIQKHPEFADHAILSAQIRVPTYSQMRTSLRAVTQMPFIPMPTADDQKNNCSISQKFQTAIRKQDVDLAFQYWSQEFERVLQTLGRVHAQMPYSKVAAKRGQILFHEQRLFPKRSNNGHVL